MTLRNGRTFPRVWDYTIGRYQVIKKWLSYRELELLGCPLTPDEAREVMNMARRIAAIVLLEPALNANYQAVKDATYSMAGLIGQRCWVWAIERRNQ